MEKWENISISNHLNFSSQGINKNDLSQGYDQGRCQAGWRFQNQ